MKNWYLIGISVMTFCGCNWGLPHNPTPAINQDTLAFTYQVIKQKASDCATKADSNCTVINIKYPLFKNQEKLNDTIKHRMLALFIIDKPDSSIEAYTRHFLAQYYVDTAQKSRPPAPYELDLNTTIIRQDSSLTTLQIDGYTYTGGAHGSTLTWFINWNTKSEQRVTLNDVLRNGYEKELTRVGDSIFRVQEHLSAGASLKGNYFFKNDVFSLPTNYAFTPVGIRFLYNQYDIKPYAAGQTNLLIPYSKIKSLILPHTVISQYNK